MPLPVEKQVMAIYLGTKGYLDDVAVKDITRMESEFLDFMDANHPEIGASIRDEKKITDENEAALKKAIVEFKDTFIVSEGRCLTDGYCTRDSSPHERHQKYWSDH